MIETFKYVVLVVYAFGRKKHYVDMFGKTYFVWGTYVRECKE